MLEGWKGLNLPPNFRRKMEQVVAFVKNRLSSILSGTQWVDISASDAVGKLASKFSVYMRKRELASVASSVNDFSNYQSLVDIQSSDETFLVACDSEWFENPNERGPDKKRKVLSWQFAFIREGYLYEVVFMAMNTTHRLNLQEAIAVLYCLYDEVLVLAHSYDTRRISRYAVTVIDKNGNEVEEVFTRKKEAAAYSADIRKKIVLPKKAEYQKICLLFHTALVDITATNIAGLDYILRRLTSVQHGALVSLQSMYLTVNLQANKYASHARILPVELSVRDTLTQAAPGEKSLEDLGDSIGFPKLRIASTKISSCDGNPDHDEEYLKSNMNQFLLAEPIQFMEYASTDSVVTLLYASALYGENVVPKVTLTSAAAGVMRSVIADYLGIDLTQKGAFDLIYRGLRTVKKGQVATPGKKIPYIQATALEPLNPLANDLQFYASCSYHGGLNSCSKVGYFDYPTNDYDLFNAYPTAMCLVEDVDWKNPVSRELEDFDIQDEGATLFANGPILGMFAYVDHFNFPRDTAFTALPLMVNGNPIYPLNYNSEDECCSDVPGLYITGVELFLAYKLGAHVHVNKAYIFRPRYKNENGTRIICRSLAEGVYSLVDDRNKAKAYAKGNPHVKKNGKYFCDTILKVMVNSCYGKVAQNVIEKETWDAYTEEMTSMGASFITNPVSASIITAVVRCVLIAAMNQCVNAGYHVFSVTTDGFISDVPEEVLFSFDLYGLARIIQKSRLFLTNGQSSALWEVKHTQSNLLNITTRGNVSSDVDGVFARNGLSTGFKKSDKGSYAERVWFMQRVLERKGKVECKVPAWTRFKEIMQKKKADFFVETITKHISMDFDMKRKPVRDSMQVVKPIVAGIEYEIANFDTIPFVDVAEYKKYKSLKDWIVTERKRSPSRALRTVYNWENLFFRRMKYREKKAAANVASNKPQTSASKKQVPTINQSIELKDDSKVSATTRKIRYCLYAHRAGVITIPLLASDPDEFFKQLNAERLCKQVFTKSGMKNYGKKDRWPWPIADAVKGIGLDNLKNFMEEQEPIYSHLMSL